MQIEINIDSTCREPKLIIQTDKMTEELERIIRMLGQGEPLTAVAGFRDGSIILLEPEDIVRVYTSGGVVTAVSAQGEHTLRLRLYELEERLGHSGFVRISHSELVNLRRVESFDLSLAGTICIKLANGDISYASRRYVSRIKHALGI